MKKHFKKVIKYGAGCQQFVQLFKAKHLKRIPVVIVIHGGYWKDNHSLDSYATSAIVDYLQIFDVAIWNLEYRRMETEGDNTKAPWPSSFKDVADGIDHLRIIEEKENLDLKRILLIGHSAGGLLATWAASRMNISESSELYNSNPLPIQKVISISGILNLFAINDVSQPEQIARLMGGNHQTHLARYRACNPSSLHDPELNLTVVHGEKDSCVKVSQAEFYCEKNKGSNVKKIIMHDADHFSMLPHDGQWQPSQWHQIKKLIAQEINNLIQEQSNS